jgi:hypothetical protein
VTQVSEHVERNFPQVQSQWKQNISFVQPSPISSNFEFSIKDSRFFQMSSWDFWLIEGLGYSNNFGFIGRGWGLLLSVSFVALMALYLALEKDSFNVF